MSIERQQLSYEEEHLSNTISWLEQEINISKYNNEKVNEKVSKLKKGAKGKYSFELYNYENILEKSKEKLQSYIEVESNPYFARIDFQDYRHGNEKIYIGKIGLTDSKTEEEKVIDWRAPIADLYYSGTEGEVSYQSPIGEINGILNLKRKFLIRNEKLIDAFDEGINELILKSGSGDNELVDEFLKINLEEGASNKLKDIVATIQKEQNDIIRADKNIPMVVQGSAGSGKTTVALHRLAYLLFKYKEKLQGNDILLIAPNQMFLDYISEVLPNLGANQVQQTTFEKFSLKFLKIKKKLYLKDEKLFNIIECNDKEHMKLIKNSSRLKNSRAFKVILDRYLKYVEFYKYKFEDIKIEDYTVLQGKKIRKLFLKDLENLSINKRIDELKRYLSLKIKNKIGDIHEAIDFSFANRVKKIKDSMEDGEKRRAVLIALYDERDLKKKNINRECNLLFDEYFDDMKINNFENLYLDLFQNKDIFLEVTSGKIPENLYKFMRQELNNNFNNNIIDIDDLAPLMYIKSNICGKEYNYKHIVLDEAQDFSTMQFYALKNFCASNSFTIVGDLGQGIYYYKGIEDWDKNMGEVFGEHYKYVQLTQSYRSTVEIVNLANKVLDKESLSIKAAKPVFRHGNEPEIIKYDNSEEFLKLVQEIVKRLEDMDKKRIAIIGKDTKQCEHIYKLLKKNKKDWKYIKDTDTSFESNRVIIPSYLSKGLEFDCTIIYNGNDENYTYSPLDSRLLYVSLTRALHFQFVLYEGKLTPLLS